MFPKEHTLSFMYTFISFPKFGSETDIFGEKCMPIWENKYIIDMIKEY